jgi:hypothetical protein
MFGMSQDSLWLLHEVIQTVPEKRRTIIIKGIILDYYVRTYNIIQIDRHNVEQT